MKIYPIVIIANWIITATKLGWGTQLPTISYMIIRNTIYAVKFIL